jgi:hypothetical protein
MPRSVLFFLAVLCSRFVANAQLDSISPLLFEVVINAPPQAHAISDGEARHVFAVTGSLTEPLIFPPIGLALQAPNLSRHSVQMGESSFANVSIILEPGVLLTSCFFKGLNAASDSFEEGFCLRWLHPVGVYDSHVRRRIAQVKDEFQFNHSVVEFAFSHAHQTTLQRMIFGTFFDMVPVLKSSKCLPVDCPRRMTHPLELDFDELSAAFHRLVSDVNVHV